MTLQQVPTVNVKKADKYRYWLTFLLKDLPVRGSFRPDALHLTIVPWFVTEAAEKDIIDSFFSTFSGHAPLELQVGPRDEFNYKRRIPINLIELSPMLLKLHMDALNWIKSLEGRWAVENPHVAEEFVPHIRRRQARNVKAGDALNITSLSLVKARRRGDDYREVAAKVEFDAKA